MKTKKVTAANAPPNPPEPQVVKENVHAAVLEAADDFVQKWIMHPRDPELVGPAHAELIRAVLNRRYVVAKQNA